MKKKISNVALVLEGLMLIILSCLISFQGWYITGIITILVTITALFIGINKKLFGYLFNLITAVGLLIVVFLTNYSTIEDPHLSCFDVCIGSDMLIIITKLVTILAFFLSFSLMVKYMVEKK